MSIYYVAPGGSNENTGELDSPFKTINYAAHVVKPGDQVLVHEGTYREWVNPEISGTATAPITFMAVPGEHAVIKVSEEVNGWEKVTAGVYKVEIDNKLFEDGNPFATRLFGDWLEKDNGRHAGQLFCNGQAFYEASDYDEMEVGAVRKEVEDYTTKTKLPEPNPTASKYKWFAEVNDQTTILYANFHELNPNDCLTEVTTRTCCFFPKKTEVNYINVKGFEICQAATPWAPPTAEQLGMVGPHWAKGWQITDCELHDAKCSAISLGCPEFINDNRFSKVHDKPGYQYQLERVFNAERAGWNKENIGHHLIKNNIIHDCGQCGIVGHLGGIFSRIEHNHVYRIGDMFEFGGWEIAGIKLHAAIDTVLFGNQVDHCALGTWFDWQCQGTRITKNVYHHNVRDLLIEMCHGPVLVDHNIFASQHTVDEFSQGVAFVNNLFAGENTTETVLNRATPYHLPHSTAVMGYAMNYGGDDRFLNNIFVKQDGNKQSGTDYYDGSTTSLTEYIDKVKAMLPGDVELFETVRQPVMIKNNTYLNGAAAFDREDDPLVLADEKLAVNVTEEDGQTYLDVDLPKSIAEKKNVAVTTESLGKVRIADAGYENPDGTAVELSSDYLGNEGTVVGPLANLTAGKNHILVWKRSK